MPVMTSVCRESSASYRSADGRDLPLLVFEPGKDLHTPAGIVLFHGGGLRNGSADGLAPHCRSLASHGVFAVSAGYRLLGDGAASIDDCLADVRRAIKQFGLLAASRGLEAPQLASGGSSAGAHLALVAATAQGAPTAAVVALNPAGSDLRSFEPDVQRRLEQQAGIAAGRLTEYSLVELVRPGTPPTLIHHGSRDEVEPIDAVRRFRDAMVRAGNACTLIEYEDAGHGFHYPGNGGHFDEVIDTTARFILGRAAEK
jgi:acetyl esterase/lipase